MTVRRFVTENLPRLFEVVGTDILQREARRPVPVRRARVEIRIEKAEAGRPDEWQRLVPRQLWSSARKFLARSDVGYLALVDDRFVGWVWLSRTSHRDPWSGLRIRLAADEGYGYALWVAPELRPQGVPAALMAALLQDVHDDPRFTRVYCWVDKRNREGQILLRLLGFTQLQHVRRAHLLRRIGWKVPRSDEPAYGPLSLAGRHQASPAE